MNGFDIQSANEVATLLRSMQRRAHKFGHDRERLLLEIGFMAENFEQLADRIEAQMYEQMFLQDSDGSACLGIQIGEAA